MVRSSDGRAISVATPRIGQEVIVDFLEGDPDQPIITGRVYNAQDGERLGFAPVSDGTRIVGFAAFFLGEYVAMFVLSLLASTIFFGGWQIPFVPHDFLVNLLFGQDWIVAILGFVVLLLKAAFFMWLYVWVRWTLPRFRYDQLMSLGWKFMLPIGLANVFVTAVVMAFLSFG